MTNLRLVNDAYLYLLELIDSGVEYPDAEHRAATKFDVSADEVREMYDGEDYDYAAAHRRQQSTQA